MSGFSRGLGAIAVVGIALSVARFACSPSSKSEPDPIAVEPEEASTSEAPQMKTLVAPEQEQTLRSPIRENPAPRATSEQSADSADSETVKAAAPAMSPEMQACRKYLEVRHGKFITNKGTWADPVTELAMAGFCVEAVMRSQGREDRGDLSAPEAARSFSIRQRDDEWVFVTNNARFAFPRGEFPAYDLARERRELGLSGKEVDPPTDDEYLLYENLYLMAQAVFEYSAPSMRSNQ